MNRFQISGTIINATMQQKSLLALAKSLNCILSCEKEGYLLKSKSCELLFDFPLIQGKVSNLEEVSQKLQDSLKRNDCLYNIEVYEQNGRPIDRWQG